MDFVQKKFFLSVICYTDIVCTTKPIVVTYKFIELVLIFPSIIISNRVMNTDQNMLFVDARTEEYYKEGHIPKAVCNDNLDLLITKMEKHISIDDGFIVYCSDDDCGSSEELAYLLQEQGFSKIYLFKGGWKQWVDNNLPIEVK